MWFRAFCRSATELSPAELVARLHAAGVPAEPHFTGDDLGWTGAKLVLPGSGSPVQAGRYLTAVDELRKDLNGFAAEVEAMTYYPGRHALMERVIQTQQLVTLRRPLDHADEATLDALCRGVVFAVAAAADGVVQIDGQGWFDAAGELLVAEY
jgi:hypothetical protein